MRTLYRLAQSNWLPRFLVGSLVLIFLYQGVVGEEKKTGTVEVLAVANASRYELPGVLSTKDRLVQLAQSDHIALLKWAMDQYDKNVQDFTVTLLKQERINGKLQKQETISVKFKDEPFSVYMQWLENAGKIDKLLYVEGQNDNQMVVHPSGLLSWIKSVKRSPQDEQVRKTSRRTCDQFGFYRSMESILSVYELAKKNQELQTVYVGQTTVLGRPCVSIERLLPPHAEFPYARLVMDFDAEYALPISIASYDWQGNLLSQYQFQDLKLNVGLTASAFTPQANGL